MPKRLDYELLVPDATDDEAVLNRQSADARYGRTYVWNTGTDTYDEAAGDRYVDDTGEGYDDRGTNPGDVYLGPDQVAALTPTTGTVDLDLAVVNGLFLTHGALTGNITYTSSNRGAGRTVIIRIVNGGTLRTFTFPSGWVFLGAAKPASIAASKTAVLSVTWYGTADSDAVAAYAVEP